MVPLFIITKRVSLMITILILSTELARGFVLAVVVQCVGRIISQHMNDLSSNTAMSFSFFVCFCRLLLVTAYGISLSFTSKDAVRITRRYYKVCDIPSNAHENAFFLFLRVQNMQSWPHLNVIFQENKAKQNKQTKNCITF